MSLQIMNDFMKAKHMQIVPEKRIINTKLTFILNDQFAHYVQKNSADTFLSFLFQNAMSKNHDDLLKVSDFFSRIYNTLEQSVACLYEFKTFLYLLTQEKDGMSRISEYLKIRSILLKLKDEEPGAQTGTSLIFLKPTEVEHFLNLFDLNKKYLEDFLENEGFDFDNQSLSLDVLIYIYLVQTTESQKFNFSVVSAEKVKVLLRKNKLRRVMLKVKFLAGLLVALRKHQDSKQISQYSDALEEMRQILKESTHGIPAQAQSNFQQSFFSLHSDVSIGKLESIVHNFKFSTDNEIENFQNFLYQSIIFQKDPEANFKHFVQFLHLKQLSDAVKLSQIIEKYKAGETVTAEQTQFMKLLKKEFFLYGLFKKAALEHFAEDYASQPQKIFADRFAKNEQMDKEIISFIKRSEMNLTLKLNDLLEQRAKEIEGVFSKIKMLPLADELVNILKPNMDKITADTKLSDLFAQAKTRGRLTNFSSSIKHMTAKEYLTNLQDNMERKNFHLCVKCKSICSLTNQKDDGEDNLTESQIKEKLLYDDYLQSKAILDYVNTYRIQYNEKAELNLPLNYFASISPLQEQKNLQNILQNEVINDGKLNNDKPLNSPQEKVKSVKFDDNKEPSASNSYPRRFTGKPNSTLKEDNSLPNENEENQDLSLPDLELNLKIAQKNALLNAPVLNSNPRISIANEALSPPSNIQIKNINKNDLEEVSTNLSAPNLMEGINLPKSPNILQPPTINMPNKIIGIDKNPPLIRIHGKQGPFEKDKSAPILEIGLNCVPQFNSMNCPTIDYSRGSVHYQPGLNPPPLSNRFTDYPSIEIPAAPQISLNSKSFKPAHDVPPTPIINIKLSNNFNANLNNLPLVRIPKKMFKSKDMPVPPVILLKMNKGNESGATDQPPQLDLSFLRRSSSIQGLSMPKIEFEGYNQKRHSLVNDLYAPLIKGAKTKLTDEFIPMAPIVNLSFKNDKSSQFNDKAPNIKLNIGKDLNQQLEVPNISVACNKESSAYRTNLKFRNSYFDPLIEPQLHFKKNQIYDLIMDAPVIDFPQSRIPQSNKIPRAPNLSIEISSKHPNNFVKNALKNNEAILLPPKINTKVANKFTQNQLAPLVDVNLNVKAASNIKSPGFLLNKTTALQPDNTLIPPSIEGLRPSIHVNSTSQRHLSIVDMNGKDLFVPDINIRKSTASVQQADLNPPHINFKPKVLQETLLRNPQQSIEVKQNHTSNLLEPPVFVVRSSISLKKDQILAAPPQEVLQTKGYANILDIKLPPSEEEQPQRTYSIDYPVDKKDGAEQLEKQSATNPMASNVINPTIQNAFRKSRTKKELTSNIVIKEEVDDDYLPLDSEFMERRRQTKVDDLRSAIKMRASQASYQQAPILLSELNDRSKNITENISNNDEPYESEVHEISEKILREHLNCDNPRTMSINYPVHKPSKEKPQYRLTQVRQDNQLDNLDILSPYNIDEIEGFRRKTTQVLEQNKINNYINDILSETNHDLDIKFPEVDEEESYPRTSHAYLPLAYVERDDEYIVLDNKSRIPKAPKLFLKDDTKRNPNIIPSAPKIEVRMSIKDDEPLLAPYIMGKFINPQSHSKHYDKQKRLSKVNLVPEVPKINMRSSLLQTSKDLSVPQINIKLKSDESLKAPADAAIKLDARHSVTKDLTAPHIPFTTPDDNLSRGLLTANYNTLSEINPKAPTFDNFTTNSKYTKNDMPAPRIHNSISAKAYGNIEAPVISINSNKYAADNDISAKPPTFETSKHYQDSSLANKPPLINYSLTYNLGKQSDKSIKPAELDAQLFPSKQQTTLKIPTIKLFSGSRGQALNAPLNIMMPVKRYHDDPLAPPDVKLNKIFAKRIELNEPPKLDFSKKNKKCVNFQQIEEVNDQISHEKKINSSLKIPAAPIINWNSLKNRELDIRQAPILELKQIYLGKNIGPNNSKHNELLHRTSSLQTVSIPPLLPPTLEDQKAFKDTQPRLSKRTLEIIQNQNLSPLRHQTVFDYLKFPLRNPTNYQKISIVEDLLSRDRLKTLPKSNPISIHSSLIFENISKSTSKLPLMPPVLLSAFSKSMILSELSSIKNKKQIVSNNNLTDEETNKLENPDSLMVFVNLANLTSKCKPSSRTSSNSSEIYVKLPPIAVSDGRKMRTLFWEKIEPSQLVSTIWIQVYNSYVGIMLNKLLEFFEDNVQGLYSSAKIDLIHDELREKAITFIMAKLFKIQDFSWPKLAKALWEVDIKDIGLENMLALKKILPTKLEIEAASELKQQDLNRLDSASSWIIIAMSVPRLKHRLNFLELQSRIDSEFHEHTKFIKDFLFVCEFLQTNKQFQKFLRLCIDAGNVLNSEKSQGAALGFKINSLLQFCNCKSIVRNGLTLMEYILYECCIQDPQSLDFIREINMKLTSIASKNLEDVVEDLIYFKKLFYQLKVELEEAELDSSAQDLYFVKRFQGFFVKYAESVVILEEESIRLKEFYQETMIFLGESDKFISNKKSKQVIAPLTNVFNHMHVITTKFNN